MNVIKVMNETINTVLYYWPVVACGFILVATLSYFLNITVDCKAMRNYLKAKAAN